ncbi:molybdenum cofactor biosynthesis protein MoaE [Altererythrobacter aquiaggeris]|uniref:molybdenum cofactor biosynthesis protein MoaE n=1 Tax=Aestuarierythrobacter aquiaggeris TaxID=1898396 RepID=UPI0030190A2F
MRDIRLLTAPFAPGLLIGPFSQANPRAGGICTFVGEVRGNDGAGGVEALELSHYGPITLPGMNELADQALDRFDLTGLLMVHRVGRLYPGEPIVCVSAASVHRRCAIQATDFCMDHLKSRAWFWKRELRADGWHWIEPRAQDHADLARWSKKIDPV